MSNKKENYKEFCNILKDKILGNPSWNISSQDYKFYPDGYTGGLDPHEQEFVYSTNIKYHGEAFDVLKGDFIALTLHMAGESECMCRFSLEYLFSEYEDGGWEQVEYILQENFSLAKSTNIDYVFAHITEYEVIKERLMIRPVNYTKHKSELEKHIYKSCGDIALVLYAVLYDDQRGLGSIKMPKDVVESWEKGVEDVFEEALIQTFAHAQPRLYTSLWDTIKTPIDKGAFMSLNSDVSKIEKFEVPLVTTTKKTNGAIAMFYPGVQEKIAQLFGCNYYVAFTSIHEARIHHCDSISPQRIEASLRDINEHFEPTEVLSELVFYYDIEKKTLEPLVK